MATLTANISSSANEFTVTGDVSGARTTAEYRIDDEIITLRKFVRELFGVRNPWGQLNRSKWVVSRGVNGTTPASHLAGAEIVGTLEAVATSETIAEPLPFVDTAGGIQTVRLLGPYPITFDTPSLNADPLPLDDLAAGQTVVKAWAAFSERWNNFDTASIFIAVVDPADNTNIRELVQYDALSATLPMLLPPDPLALMESPPSPNVASRSAAIVEPCKLGVGLSAAGGTAADAGACEIYALVAEPSA